MTVMGKRAAKAKAAPEEGSERKGPEEAPTKRIRKAPQKKDPEEGGRKNPEEGPTKRRKATGAEGKAPASSRSRKGKVAAGDPPEPPAKKAKKLPIIAVDTTVLGLLKESAPPTGVTGNAVT